MFHSSSSRHEQYLIRSSPSKATLHKNRSSLESEVSGADSGYTSSSSTLPSGSPTSTSAIQQQHHVTNKKIRDSNDDDNISTATTTTNQTIISTPTSNMTDAPDTIVTTTAATKKKKSKRHQPPRQPDLVYSCPRPLAFPFHNDDHFLPIAEADPRDVARVSPSSLNRSSSLQSSKTSIGSTRMYDNGSYQYTSGASSRRAIDAESSYSHQSSILSTIQRGTVRSIRSLFQLPDSLSNNNKDGLSRVQTNNTSHTTYSSNTRHTADSSTSTIQQQPRLEIKKGTVQSIKDMFSMKRASLGVTQVVPTPPQKGYVGATIGQFESSSSYSRASINAAAAANKSNRKQAPPAFKPVAVNVTKSESKKSFASRASQFANKAFWRSSSSPSSKASSTPTTTTASNRSTTSPATKPLPKTPSTSVSPPQQPKSSIKSEVKKLSARVFAFGRSSSSNNNSDNVSQTPRTSTARTNEAAAAAAAPPPPKRSIFSSFKRSNISASVSNNNKKKPTTATENEMSLPTATATTVSKMWKSFKNLVTGKKSSRVGVL